MLAVTLPVALAQSYPTRPVHIVVGFTPGGSTDVAARVVGQCLSDRMGWQIVVENRPGAGANIATEAVARALPDGYTLLLLNSADTINATLYDKLAFNFLRDIAPVASVTRQPQLILANPSLPAKTFSELISLARANPGKLNIASPGRGTIGHLSGEMLKLETGTNFVHVHYRGAAPALTDVLAGHVQLYIGGLAGSIEYAQTGKLRAFAVTSATRTEALPDTPTVSEFVPGYEALSLFGLGAPKGTPPDVIDTLNNAVNTCLADPKVEARFADLGGTVYAGTPQAFAKLLAEETEKWGRVIRAANIKPE